MVIAVPTTRQSGTRGSLSVELALAAGILAAVLLPLSLAFPRDQAALRSRYYRAVAIEIVDGEMEVLAAGEWAAFSPGRQPYPVGAKAAEHLPPGGFFLTLTPDRIRLEWIPEARGAGGIVAREALRKSAPADAASPSP